MFPQFRPHSITRSYWHTNRWGNAGYPFRHLSNSSKILGDTADWNSGQFSLSKWWTKILLQGTHFPIFLQVSPPLLICLPVFTPLSSTSAGLSLLYAWCRRTAQSCSSPASWRSGRTGRCRSTCNRGAALHRSRLAGHLESSSRW